MSNCVYKAANNTSHTLHLPSNYLFLLKTCLLLHQQILYSNNHTIRITNWKQKLILNVIHTGKLSLNKIKKVAQYHQLIGGHRRNGTQFNEGNTPKMQKRILILNQLIK